MGRRPSAVRRWRSSIECWRATARTGELMVRLEEQPWKAQATLLLDTRSRAHLVARGWPFSDEPDPDGDGPTDGDLP